MLTVTIHMCAWCYSARPIRVDGVERIPPGLHDAKVQVSHGMCTTCEVKFVESMQKGGATHSGTSEGDNATEEKKGS